MVYLPREDSYLLAEAVTLYLKKFNKHKIGEFKVLDMGSGSGFQAENCLKCGVKKDNILCVDIDKAAVNFLSEKGLNVIMNDLFSDKGCFPYQLSNNKKFDLILFNPPYLPEDSLDKGRDTTGGSKGYEIIMRFLRDAKNYLLDGGVIMLLVSSFSNIEEIEKYIEKLKYKKQKINEKKMFFEKIEVWEIRRQF